MEGGEIPYAEAIGLQFGILTDEDIENWKLPEVTQTTKKNTSLIGTVNCPSSGPLNSSSLCLRCGNEFEHCQGHPMKLTLFQPVINVNYIPILLKAFPTICIRCFRVLAPNSILQKLVQSRSIAPSNYKKSVSDLFKLCSKTNKVCWFPEDPNELAAAQKRKKYQTTNKKKRRKQNEDDEEEEEDEEVVVANSEYEQPHLLSMEEAKTRGYCGTRQPDIWMRYEKFFIRPSYYMQTAEDYDLLPIITPRKMYGMLKFLQSELIRLYGFNPQYSPLKGMMSSLLYIPPPLSRLPRSIRGNDDDLTATLSDIQKINESANRSLTPNLTLGLVRPDPKSNQDYIFAIKTRNKMKQVQGILSSKRLRKKMPIISQCNEDYYLLQREVACYWDSKYHTNLDRERRKKRFCLRRRFVPRNKDRGRVRGNMLGKPTDNSMRSVSSCNTNMDIDEVGVPKKAAMSLTTPVTVTPYNYNDMLRCVMNGRSKYPGCTFIERDGKLFAPDANYGGLRLGDIVHEHLRNGKVVIANRQPSLHRFAIMGYRVVVHPDSTIDGSLAVTPMLNEDYDGDEKNIYVPQSEEKRAEVARLITVRKNLVKDGKLVIGFVQHSAIGVEQITNEDKGPLILKKHDVQQYLMIGNHEPSRKDFVKAWHIYNDCNDLTGREFMRLALPTYDGKETLNKNTLNEYMCMTINSMQDMEDASYKIGFLTRILETVASESGISITMDDVLLPVDAKTRLESNAILQDAIAFAKKKDQAKITNEIVDEIGLEEDICRLLSRYRDVLGTPLLKTLQQKPKRSSGIHTIIASKVKGDGTAVVQNLRVVGQQNNENSVRYQETTSHYYRDPVARQGFVKNGLIDGVTPVEKYRLLMTGRVGAVRTICQTSLTGYVYRKIFKSAEDERICHQNTVRNANGQIINFYYGYDTTFLRPQKLESVTRTIAECVAFFLLEQDFDVDQALEIEHLLLLRQRVVTGEVLQLSVLVPLNFDRECPSIVICKHPKGKKCQPVAFNAARNRVCKLWNKLVVESVIPSTPLHELCFFEQMSTKLLSTRGYLKCSQVFNNYLVHVEQTLASNVCCVGDACGMKCSQDTTQPSTQAGLSLFKIAGEKTIVVDNTARFKEIINLPKQIQQPMMQIFVLPEHEASFDPMTLVELRLEYIVSKYDDFLVLQTWENHLALNQITPSFSTEHKNSDLAHLSLYLDKDAMHRREISPRAVVLYLQHTRILQFDIQNVAMTYANLRDDVWWVMLSIPRTSKIFQIIAPQGVDPLFIPSPELVAMLKQTLKSDKALLAGVEGIHDFKRSKKTFIVADESQDGKLISIERDYIETRGSNLQAICAREGIDVEETCTNDIMQMFQVFGIDAAQTAIYEGLMEATGITYDNPACQHIKLIAATMCFSGFPSPMTYSGMTARETASWLQRALFERSWESFLGASIAAHLDPLLGVSPSVMFGKPISIGTGGPFQIIDHSTENAPLLPLLPQNAEQNFLALHKKPLTSFQFTVPDISDFLATINTPHEDDIEFDLNLYGPNDPQNANFAPFANRRTTKRKAIPNSGIGTGVEAVRKVHKKLFQTGNHFFSVHRNSDDILVPTSPILRPQSCKMPNFGPDCILIPSSPKTKKRRAATTVKREHKKQFYLPDVLVPTSP